MSSASSRIRNDPLYKIDDILVCEKIINGYTRRERVQVIGNPVWVEEDENGNLVRAWKYPVAEEDIMRTRHPFMADERQLSPVIPPKYAVDDILEHSNGDHEETVIVTDDPTWDPRQEPGLPSTWFYPVRDILTQRTFDAREWQLQRVDNENYYMKIRRNGKTYYTNAQVDSDWASSDSDSSDSDDDDDDEEVQSAAGGRKYMAEDRAPPSKRRRRELWENLRF